MKGLPIAITILLLAAAMRPAAAAWVEPERPLPLTADALAAAEGQAGGWVARGDGIAHTGAAAEPALLLVGDESWSRYTVETRVRFDEPTTGARAGLVFQARDAARYVYFTLERRHGGFFAVLGFQDAAAIERYRGESPLIEEVFTGDVSRHKELDAGEWHTLRADVEGAEVVCYLDGEPAARYWFMGTPPPFDHFGQVWPADPTHGRVGVIAAGCAARFEDLSVSPLKGESPLPTPLRGRRDAQGRLLPLRSYDETMRMLNDWMVTSAEVVDPSPAPASLRHLPPYLLTNWLSTDNRFWLLGGEYGFNHSISILGAVQYYYYSGDERVLQFARDLADWHIENRVPADAKVPHLIQSVVNWQEDGTWEGMEWGLEMDKSAYMGYALLRLYAASGDERYLNGARDLASVLRKYQSEEGNWPFRINALTGEIKEAYSCSQLWYVHFFDKLYEIDGKEEDRERSRKALQWLLDGPVKDNRWFGVYGDVLIGAESHDQWVPIETAIYLIDHRDEFVGAVRIAEDILDYLKRTLIVDYGFHPDVPGLLEQGSFSVVETIQEFRIAELYAKLYEATGREDYKQAAVAAANSTTWCQVSDGKMRQGLWYLAIDSPLVLSYNYQLCRIMGSIPETAPRDQNHLLHNTSDLTRIAYRDDGVSYATLGPGEETLVVRARPRQVTAGGEPLNRLRSWGFDEDGWWYDEQTGQLRIRHAAPAIEIVLEQ